MDDVINVRTFTRSNFDGKIFKFYFSFLLMTKMILIKNLWRQHSPFCSNPTNPFCRVNMKPLELSRSTPMTNGHLRRDIVANIAAQLHIESKFEAPNEAMRSEMKKRMLKLFLWFLKAKKTFFVQTLGNFIRNIFHNITCFEAYCWKYMRRWNKV